MNQNILHPHFVKTEGPLPCLKQLASDPNPESDESGPHSTTISLNILQRVFILSTLCKERIEFC